MLIIAWFFAAFGLFVTGINVYLSWLRYPLHKLLHGDEPYKWSSGVPGFGSLSLWISAGFFASLNRPNTMWFMLAVSLLDTYGLHWFALVMATEWWKERKGK